MEERATPGGAVAGRSIVHAAPHLNLRNTLLLATLACSLLVGCGDSSTILGTLPEMPPPATPAELADADIRLVSGDSQEGEVATLLADSLVVEVTTSSGAPLGGAPVEWRFDAGHPPLAGGATVPDQRLVGITDRNGRASTRWVLGTGAGDQSVAARVMVPESTAPVGEGPSLAPGDLYRYFWGRARPGSAYSLTVTPAEKGLIVGDSVQLAAQVKDRYGNVLQGRSIIWASSAQTVATITETGKARAISPGAATMRATSESVTGTSALTVTAGESVPVPPPTITVRDQNALVVQSLTLVRGTSATLSATATTAAGVSLGTIIPTWSSSSVGVATVSALGVVQALAAGSTNLVATYQGSTKTIPTMVTVPVSPPPPPPPPTTGVPQPSGSIRLDTRSGGAQSIQASTSLATALSVSGFHADATDASGSVVTFTTDADGAGSKAFRFDWKGVGATTEVDLSLYRPMATVTAGDTYLQMMIWQSRTASGGGIGTAGDWDCCSQGPGSGKRMVWFRSSGGNSGRLAYAPGDRSFRGQLFVESTYNPATASTPFNWDALVSQWIALTIRIAPETSVGARNGRIQVWVNNTLTHDVASANTYSTGLAGELQIGGPTWIGVPQDQTMYVKDIVVWQP